MMAFGFLGAFFVLLQYAFKPYLDVSCHWLEIISVSLHMCLAIFLSGYRDISASSVDVGVLLLFTLPAALFLVCVAIITIRRRGGFRRKEASDHAQQFS